MKKTVLVMVMMVFLAITPNLQAKDTEREVLIDMNGPSISFNSLEGPEIIVDMNGPVVYFDLLESAPGSLSLMKEKVSSLKLNDVIDCLEWGITGSGVPRSSRCCC